MKLLGLMICLGLLAWPVLTARAEHTVPFCYGGELGYWTPGVVEDGTVLLYLTHQNNGVLDTANTICRVHPQQKIKAVVLEKVVLR